MIETQPFFQALCGGYDRNFTYILGCPTSGELALIDSAVPWIQIEEVLKRAKSLGYKKLTKIFLTHSHHDHIASLKEVVLCTNAQVYSHEAESKRVKSLVGIEIKHFIQDKEVLNFGQESLKTIHTPGHQPGCICFIWRNKIFTGDTLFVEGCGRCNFPESNYEDQFNSLRFIANHLPNELEIHPGHNYGSTSSSTIGREKVTNKYLIGLEDKQVNENTKKNWIALRQGIAK